MLTGRKVLLVGDDDPFFETAIDALVEAGAEPAAAKTADDALALLRREEFELIVVELHLLGMNGYELCRKLEEDPRLAEIPVLAASTNPFVNSINIGTCSNVADFLRMPCTGGQLVDAVSNVVAGKPGPFGRAVRDRMHGDGSGDAAD